LSIRSKRPSEIKHAQKESVLAREVAQFLVRIIQDDQRLQGLYVNRARLSPDKGTCLVYIHTSGGLKDFEAKFQFLVVYKPSIRASLSKTLQGRYTPQIKFLYDAAVDKTRHVDDLIDRLKEEGKL